MKLNLGETLRTLRKNADMTQEQLAERLGMSCQAISRWENGNTYPDLELLPVLADIFGVTSDFLLGIPDEKKESQAKEVFTELVKATHEKETNPEQIIRLIREIRLHHLKSRHFHHFWLSARQSTFRIPEILPEVRITAETILEGNFDKAAKEETIRHFSCLEQEENINAFLDKYAAGEDLSKKHLLYNRYMRQNMPEKRNLLRQEFLMEHMDQLVGNLSLWDIPTPGKTYASDDYAALHRKNRLCLALLHQFCQITPDRAHPVSGNGEVDLWIEPRLLLGTERVALLSRAGRYEEAILTLADITALLEKAMAITAPVTLGCASPWLQDILWTAKEDWGEPDNYLPNRTEERMLMLHDESWNCYCVYPSTYYRILTMQECVGPFAGLADALKPLQEKEDFRNLTERIRTLIVTRMI